MERKFMPLLEAFRSIGIGTSTGYKLVKAGKLRVIKVGRKSLVEVSQLDRFVAELVAEGQTSISIESHAQAA